MLAPCHDSYFDPVQCTCQDTEKHALVIVLATAVIIYHGLFMLDISIFLLFGTGLGFTNTRTGVDESRLFSGEVLKSCEEEMIIAGRWFSLALFNLIFIQKLQAIRWL